MAASFALGLALSVDEFARYRVPRVGSDFPVPPPRPHPLCAPRESVSRQKMYRDVPRYLGQGAPVSTQVLNLLTNSSWETDTGFRPTPGSQPHRTSLSLLTCSSRAGRSFPPLACWFLIARHSSPLER